MRGSTFVQVFRFAQLTRGVQCGLVVDLRIRLLQKVPEKYSNHVGSNADPRFSIDPVKIHQGVFGQRPKRFCLTVHPNQYGCDDRTYVERYQNDGGISAMASRDHQKQGANNVKLYLNRNEPCPWHASLKVGSEYVHVQKIPPVVLLAH
jgi:hypothetical protein